MHVVTSESILINASVQSFLAALYQQASAVNQHSRELYGRDIELDSNRTKQWAIVRELIQRRRRFHDAAMMSTLEQAAIQSFGEFLVQTFHEMQGTPEDERPRIGMMKGGGVAWSNGKKR